MSNSTLLDFILSLPRSGPALSLDYMKANPIVQGYAAASPNNFSPDSDFYFLIMTCKQICGGE